MSAPGQSVSAMALFDRLILHLMALALAAVLTAAMVMQYAFGEIPCPLCLLQRFAMFGCCFGLFMELRSGKSKSGASERGTGIGLIFAVLLLVISVRQTLLDLFPRPGHAYVGSAIFGLHMPVWSVLIAVALLLGFAVRLTLAATPNTSRSADDSPMSKQTKGLFVYVVLICAINFLSVVAQCGVSECHTSGYRLLGGAP
jgi:disulfide bond formation protein DsbB